MSVDGSTVHSSFNFNVSFFNNLSNTVAAVLPISKAGCVMVVNDGLRIIAVGWLEKHTTFT